MDVVKTFGSCVTQVCKHNPHAARRLLRAGYAAQAAKLRLAPDKRLPRSRQFIARVIMDEVRRALAHPDKSAAVSLFVPCEPLQLAHTSAYSVELLSAFLAGTQCEQSFCASASDAGFPDTLCSYHRVFLGALDAGLLPIPRFAIFTNVACDANMITFPHLKEHGEIPSFYIDVPYERSEEAVAEVALQLREMCRFVEDMTSIFIRDEDLSCRIAAEKRTAHAYLRFVESQAYTRVPSDMTSEMYAVLANHVLFGRAEVERFANMLEAEGKEAPSSNALRLVWMHLIPNMLRPVVERLSFSDAAYITVCDLATDPLLSDFDPADPYASMARRLVYTGFNGDVSLRIERACELARRTRADGVVLFTSWGCKGTIGAAPLIRAAFEQEGLPCLVLDGDGCDRANNPEGQVSTRLAAFLEMLEAKRSGQAL